MTREEAIKKHRELWHWIADEHRRRKDIWVEKIENPDVVKEGPCNSCWLCEYVIQFIGDETIRNCGDACPINWGAETCMRDGSPYKAWKYCLFSGYEERAKLADIVAELPER